MTPALLSLCLLPPTPHAALSSKSSHSLTLCRAPRANRGERKERAREKEKKEKRRAEPLSALPSIGDYSLFDRSSGGHPSLPNQSSLNASRCLPYLPTFLCIYLPFYLSSLARLLPWVVSKLVVLGQAQTQKKRALSQGRASPVKNEGPCHTFYWLFYPCPARTL